MNRSRFGAMRPLIFVFIAINALLISGRAFIERKGLDQEVLIVGNLVLFVVVMVSFLLTQKSFSSANPNSFVRAMYGSFILKFFVLAIVAFVYIMTTKKDVNKPALFICMGLYAVYTFMEVDSLMKILKQRKNA